MYVFHHPFKSADGGTRRAEEATSRLEFRDGSRPTSTWSGTFHKLRSVTPTRLICGQILLCINTASFSLCFYVSRHIVPDHLFIYMLSSLDRSFNIGTGFGEPGPIAASFGSVPIQYLLHMTAVCTFPPPEHLDALAPPCSPDVAHRVVRCDWKRKTRIEYDWALSRLVSIRTAICGSTPTNTCPYPGTL